MGYHSTKMRGLLLGVAIATAMRCLSFSCEALMNRPAPAVVSSKSGRFSLQPLSLQKGWLANNNGDDEDEDGLVTREDLNRDLLGLEPKVKRKNRKGKGYKPLDNRDHLPFSVRTKTPDDPYKTRFQKEKEKERINNKVRSKKTDLDHHLLARSSSTGAASTKGKKKPNKTKKNKNNNDNNKNKASDKSSGTTPSRLVQRRKKNGKDDDGKNNKSLTTVLGEYELDKSTTSGDVICIGDKEYRVETARCQYKYAGGQRFVMVRKILEVKELNRVQTEEALLRQFNSSPSSPSSALAEDLE